METDKIIKALRHCSVSGNSCRECPAYNQNSGCLDRLHAQAADLLEEQQKHIAELEMKAVRIQCRDDQITQSREFHIEWCKFLNPEEAMDIFVRNAERILKGGGE